MVKPFRKKGFTISGTPVVISNEAKRSEKSYEVFG